MGHELYWCFALLLKALYIPRIYRWLNLPNWIKWVIYRYTRENSVGISLCIYVYISVQWGTFHACGHTFRRESFKFRGENFIPRERACLVGTKARGLLSGKKSLITFFPLLAEIQCKKRLRNVIRVELLASEKTQFLIKRAHFKESSMDLRKEENLRDYSKKNCSRTRSS